MGSFANTTACSPLDKPTGPRDICELREITRCDCGLFNVNFDRRWPSFNEVKAWAHRVITVQAGIAGRRTASLTLA